MASIAYPIFPDIQAYFNNVLQRLLVALLDSGNTGIADIVLAIDYLCLVAVYTIDRDIATGGELVR